MHTVAGRQLGGSRPQRLRQTRACRLGGPKLGKLLTELFEIFRQAHDFLGHGAGLLALRQS